MSWLDLINTDLIITTGDGVNYFPDWMTASAQKHIEYNFTEFNFPNVPGSLVNRKFPKGRRYNLEVYFQGADHLDKTKAFETSANDQRYWTLNHPFYEQIYVQPTSIHIDNSGLNTSKITIAIIETIVDDNPKTVVSASDYIQSKKLELNRNLELILTATPSQADINKTNANNSSAYSKGVPLINIPDQAAEYFNIFNTATTYVNTATATPLLAIRATTTLLNYPAQFNISVQQRMNLVKQQLDNLRTQVSTILSLSTKQLYQAQASALLTALAESATTPLSGDYTNVKKVNSATDMLITYYNYILRDLDTLQTPNGGNPDSFIPDMASMSTLDSLVNYCISSLYDIALNSKKERSIILDSDTNLINLTHRLYGLDPSDNNINELMQNNGWGLNHILQLKKNTKVVYYI